MHLSMACPRMVVMGNPQEFVFKNLHQGRDLKNYQEIIEKSLQKGQEFDTKYLPYWGNCPLEK